MTARKTIPEGTLPSLIIDITQKKELRKISKEFVTENLASYLHQNPKARLFLSAPFSKRSAQYKSIIKDIRANLRKVYGLFRIEEEARERKELVALLGKTPSAKHRELVQKILSTHSSTKERIPFYEQLYSRIFQVTGSPATIIDLGCGINPFSIPFMKVQKLKYSAFDISEDEIDFLQQFFTWWHRQHPSFSGKAEVLDVKHWITITHAEKADVCFLFKMTDVLDLGKGHKVTESVLRNIPARFVVVSFPTKTMSGKVMNVPRRNWMEWLCKRVGYSFTILEFKNEIFYVIKKINS